VDGTREVRPFFNGSEIRVLSQDLGENILLPSLWGVHKRLLLPGYGEPTPVHVHAV
jgi:hypothetical protein